jgi:hypothetical protein
MLERSLEPAYPAAGEEQSKNAAYPLRGATS